MRHHFLTLYFITSHFKEVFTNLKYFYILLTFHYLCIATTGFEPLLCNHSKTTNFWWNQSFALMKNFVTHQGNEQLLDILVGSPSDLSYGNWLLPFYLNFTFHQHTLCFPGPLTLSWIVPQKLKDDHKNIMTWLFLSWMLSVTYFICVLLTLCIKISPKVGFQVLNIYLFFHVIILSLFSGCVSSFLKWIKFTDLLRNRNHITPP